MDHKKYQKPFKNLTGFQVGVHFYFGTLVDPSFFAVVEMLQGKFYKAKNNPVNEDHPFNGYRPKLSNNR